MANPNAWQFIVGSRYGSSASASHRNAVDDTPRRAFVDAVKAFGATYREAVKQGFGGRLNSGAPGLKFVLER